MPSRANPIHDAGQQAVWTLLDIGREIKVARVCGGRTQRQVAATVARSAAHISRVERGKVRNVSVADLTVIAAAVGLRLWLRAFPGGRRPLDAPQLALIHDLNQRIHASWRRTLEAVLPKPGDLRAVDELLSNETCTVAVEAITRIAVIEAQVRSARAKQRDIGAGRLILLVRGSHANRQVLRDAMPLLRQSFTVDARAALRALAAGADPGGDSIILL